MLCNLQSKEGPNIGYRKRLHQYWKDFGQSEEQQQYQVRSILKTSKLSKVEIERLQRQIKQLHVGSAECKTGELDRADEEVVTQDNVLFQVFTAEASGYVEDTAVSESESDITKRLKLLLKNPKNDPNAFRLKQETEEVTKAMPSITFNDISDFKNLIKTGAISDRMGIRKSVKSQQEPF